MQRVHRPVGNQNQLLRQREELAKKSVKASQQASYEQRKEAYLLPIREMTAFLASHYEFRHNVVRDSYELRRRGGRTVATAR